MSAEQHVELYAESYQRFHRRLHLWLWCKQGVLLSKCHKMSNAQKGSERIRKDQKGSERIRKESMLDIAWPVWPALLCRSCIRVLTNLTSWSVDKCICASYGICDFPGAKMQHRFCMAKYGSALEAIKNHKVGTVGLVIRVP